MLVVYREISAWIDSVLERRVPEGVGAFCFNIYADDWDNWSMELIGAEAYDPRDPDWPCYEVTDMGSRSHLFRWEESVGWHQTVREMSKYIVRYLAEGAHATALQQADVVAVAFVSGVPQVLWKKK